MNSFVSIAIQRNRFGELERNIRRAINMAEEEFRMLVQAPQLNDAKFRPSVNLGVNVEIHLCK
jgi:hypothetical protein